MAGACCRYRAQGVGGAARLTPCRRRGKISRRWLAFVRGWCRGVFRPTTRFARRAAALGLEDQAFGGNQRIHIRCFVREVRVCIIEITVEKIDILDCAMQQIQVSTSWAHTLHGAREGRKHLQERRNFLSFWARYVPNYQGLSALRLQALRTQLFHAPLHCARTTRLISLALRQQPGRAARRGPLHSLRSRSLPCSACAPAGVPA